MTATAPRPAPASEQPAAPHDSPASSRLDLVDRLRGLVIALMVLDHVREFFSADALRFEATDLAQTTPLIFATRWVTHLCAPTFVFLAGVAVYLQRRSAERGRLTRFLVTRGLWLIALELTVVGFALDLAFPFVFLEVIWAIGVGMVMLAALLRLPPLVVLALGLLIVGGHDALTSVDATDLGSFALLWRFAMELGPIPGGGFVAYPAIPWAGMLFLGYGAGVAFTWPAERLRRALLVAGAGAVALFVVLRAANGYGDPSPWSVQRSGTYTVLSFLKVSKYPPSLQFVLVTLGTSLMLAVALERLRGPLDRMLLAFGRVPLFAFVVHLYLAHGLALLVGVAMGLPAATFAHSVSDPTRLRAAGWGFGIGTVYAVWVLVLLALYPLAARYAEYKRRRRAWWTRYL